MEIEEKIIVYDKLKDETPRSDLTAKLDNLLKSIIIKEGYKIYNVERKTVSTNGGNYLGILYEIDVKGETNYGAKETHIFVKNILPNEDGLKMLSIPQAYETELFAYKELHKVFHELQEGAGIPEAIRFKMVDSFEESNTETIILDNLSKKGYKTAYRMDVVSLNYAEMAIKKLAKLHALSFTIQERRPIFFNENIKTMGTSWVFGEDYLQFITSITKLTINYVDDDIKSEMEKVFPRLLEKFATYVQNATDVSCLCHGDFRPNNIMMKEVNGEVTDLIPVDYQLLHYGSPVQDFLYFIYTSSDKEFRSKHFDFLKDLYFKEMGGFLEYFDVNVDVVYPREYFEKDLKERMDFGLIVTLMFGPFLFVDEDDVPDVTKDVCNTTFKVDDKFKKRLRGAIDEFIEWGFLKYY